MFESFEESLRKEGFDQETESTYLARGRDNLEALYSEITGRSYGELSLEYDFRAAHGGIFLPISLLEKGGVMSDTSDGGNIGTPIPSSAKADTPISQGGNRAIQLTGKINRIERLPDDTLIITDYKTGGGFDTFDGK